MVRKLVIALYAAQVFSSFLLVGALPAADSEAPPIEEITISADEWCPYNCTPGTDSPGFLVEIARAALGHGGVDVKYVEANWSRVVQLTRNGDIDGALGASESEARDEGLVYGTEPMGMSYFAFVVKKGTDWTYSGPDSLSRITFGVIQDYDNGPDVQAYLATRPKNVVTQVGDDAFEKNVKLIMAGRLDAAVEDSSVAAYRLSLMNLSSETRLVALDEEPVPIAMAFSPNEKGKRLAKMLDDGIRHIRKTGELAEILGRYGLDDWK